MRGKQMRLMRHLWGCWWVEWCFGFACCRVIGSLVKILRKNKQTTSMAASFMPRLAVICAMKCRMWRGFQKHRYDMQSDSIPFIANRLQFFHNLWKNLKGTIFHSLWKDYTPICFQYLGGIIAISLTNVPMIQVRLCSMYAKHWKMAGVGIYCWIC